MTAVHVAGETEVRGDEHGVGGDDPGCAEGAGHGGGAVLAVPDPLQQGTEECRETEGSDREQRREGDRHTAVVGVVGGDPGGAGVVRRRPGVLGLELLARTVAARSEKSAWTVKRPGGS